MSFLSPSIAGVGGQGVDFRQCHLRLSQLFQSPDSRFLTNQENVPVLFLYVLCLHLSLFLLLELLLFTCEVSGICPPNVSFPFSSHFPAHYFCSVFEIVLPPDLRRH